MPPDPSTPVRNIPPFRGRAPIPQTPISPFLPTYTSTPLPAGNFLIARGVYTAGAASDPVALVREKISAISQANLDLAQITVDVTPFSNNRDGYASSCYIRLTKDFNPGNPMDEPRCDLMEMWKDALNAEGNWMVDWAPQAEGKDKRMWVTVRGVFDTPDKHLTSHPPSSSQSTKLTDDAILQHLRAHFVDNGYYVQRTFKNRANAVMILVDPKHVVLALSARSIVVKDISTHAFYLAPGAQVEVLHAFELVVAGIAKLDGVETRIRSWLSTNFKRDGADTLVDCRIPSSHPDLFVFHMCDWASTVKVLTCKDQFKNDLQYDIDPPQLLFNYNVAGTFRVNANSIITDGAKQIEHAIKGVTQRLDAMEKDNKQDRAAVQQQFVQVNTSVNKLVTVTSTLATQQNNFARGLFILQQESDLKSALAMLELREMSEMNRLKAPLDDEDKEDAKTQIREIRKKKKEKIQQIDDLRGNVPLPIAPSTPSIPQVPVSPVPTPPISPIPSAPFDSAPSNPLPPVTFTPPGLPASRRSNRHLSGSPAATISQESPSTPTPSRDREGSVYKRPRRSLRDESPDTRSVRELIESSADQDAVMEGPNDGDKVRPPPVVPSVPSLLLREPLMATHANPALSAMKPTLLHRAVRGPDGTRGGFLAGRQAERKRVVEKHGSSRFLFPASSRYSRACITNYPKALLFLGIFAVILSFVNGANAMNNPSAFSVYALNANGLVHSGKLTHINTAIRARSPHAAILTESKTNTKTAKNLPHDTYNIFEEPGIQATNHHLYKWGVVLAIRKDVQVAQRVMIQDTALKGRVIALDIILTTDDGQGFFHRIIGAYAPWDPGQVNNFWPALTALIQQTNSSWTLAGDLNATVSPSERASGGAEARRQFNQFLQDTEAHDLWSDRSDRNRRYDWTSRPRSDLEGGSIIDRIVTSKATLFDSEIGVTDGGNDFVPFTDHRAICARIIHKSPLGKTTTFPTVHQVIGKPRIKYPPRLEKYRHDDFRSRVDSNISSLNLAEINITDDESFLRSYNALTTVLKSCGEKVYGRVARFSQNNNTITSPEIRKLLADIRFTGGAIHFIRNPDTNNVSLGAIQCYNSIRLRYSREADNTLSLLDYSRAFKRSLHKKLFALRMAEIRRRKSEQAKKQIIGALLGGSTKRLVTASEFIPMPTIVKRLDSDELASTPEEVKSITRNYWANLYKHSPPPDIPKPWMNTKSVCEVRKRVTNDPFSWPRSATLEDFRAMLRKGTPRPAPGPDEWEKWMVKALSDDALSLVLKLHNYIVTEARFPGNLKDMWLTMFHKRGMRTDLSNWRGILLSNFLANSPVSWLNFNLVPYVAKLRILPDTQVATQKGVQTRDLMSYLSAIKCWAVRHKQTIFAIKRDQMKGFDYLSPDGMYDAVHAYGLPESIIDLDKAAQSKTKCFIRTAHGITEPIEIDDVTKQGGPLSPIKATLTTSLGHRYLNDIMESDKDALIITTTSALKADPHLPGDSVQVKVSMTEATDDSFLFSRTLPSLKRMTLHMERFQFAYGWLTQWEKSTAYVIQDTAATPSSVMFDSITDNPGVDPMQITQHEVPMVTNNLDFLRARVDDPRARYEELRDFIDSFTFPKFIKRAPITLLRKIVMQNIVAKCRALLSLQPIKRVDAEELDRKIKMLVHKELGMPFAPSSDVFTLPLAHHGLDFPSIASINDGIAVDGLIRDLNHKITTYRNLARITLADWTCSINGCVNPIDGVGLNRDFTYHANRVPYTWIIAQKAMGKMEPRLQIRQTDCSAILRGDVSLSHALSISNHHHPDLPLKPDGNTLRSLRTKLVRKVADMGCWKVAENGEWQFKVKPAPPTTGWSLAAKQNWDKTENMLIHTKIEWFFNGSSDLLIPPIQRQVNAEQMIRRLAIGSKLQPSPTSKGKQIWASDGSMIPASAGLGEPKSVTAAITGPLTLVLRIDGRNISILQGELMGLIMGVVLSDSTSVIPKLLTDHLNSKRLIDDSRTLVDQQEKLRHMNGRSYYRWILSLVKAKLITIEYTPGHSDEVSIPSRMNYEADYYASTSQRHIDHVFNAPLPTFLMDDYTCISDRDGWIESNIRNLVNSYQTQQQITLLQTSHSHRMATKFYDHRPPPDHPYTRSYSAYSAVVQLYARSGQLPTADILFKRGKLEGNGCRMGCDVVEDQHHIFVTCQKYEGWRETAAEELEKRTKRKLVEKGIEEQDQLGLTQTAKSLFSDNPNVWPLCYSAYYLGHVPPLDHLLPSGSVENTLTRSRLLYHLAAEWHLTSIRLAGRIWGDWQRMMAQRNDTNRR